LVNTKKWAAILIALINKSFNILTYFETLPGFNHSNFLRCPEAYYKHRFESPKHEVLPLIIAIASNSSSFLTHIFEQYYFLWDWKIVKEALMYASSVNNKTAMVYLINSPLFKEILNLSVAKPKQEFK
jgi:hypothetical protein